MTALSLIEEAKQQGKKVLSVYESKKVLENYGLPVAPGFLVTTEEELEEAAKKIGFPVVIKVVSHDIVHKSDVGGVVVNIWDFPRLEEEYKKMRLRIKKYKPEAKIEGILVEKMVKTGIECVIGGIHDPIFGKVVMFGLGGIYVEILKDVSFRLAPIEKDEALSMINEIKGKKLLEGVRGQPPADKEKLAELIAKISHLLVEIPEIHELDLNPVMATPDGPIIVDSRIILSFDTNEE